MKRNKSRMSPTLACFPSACQVPTQKRKVRQIYPVNSEATAVRTSFEAHSPERGPSISRHRECPAAEHTRCRGTEADTGSCWRRASGSLQKPMAHDHMSAGCEKNGHWLLVDRVGIQKAQGHWQTLGWQSKVRLPGVTLG